MDSIVNAWNFAAVVVVVFSFFTIVRNESTLRIEIMGCDDEARLGKFTTMQNRCCVCSAMTPEHPSNVHMLKVNLKMKL